MYSVWFIIWTQPWRKCPNCRVDYSISDDYLCGNADETLPSNTEQLEHHPKPYDGPSDQEILNYYMYGNQYDEPVGKSPMQSKPAILHYLNNEQKMAVIFCGFL